MQKDREVFIDEKHSINDRKKKLPMIIGISAITCFLLGIFAIRIIIPDINYRIAISDMENGNYKKAISEFESLNDYKNCKELMNECKYLEAAYYMETENYKEAIICLDEIRKYKDSEYLIKKCIGIPLNNAQVGDVISFGFYEQNNVVSDGREAIEWEILDKKDGKIFVVSKYALDCQPYSTDPIEEKWENCSLRSWLNGDFLTEAFNEDERAMIYCSTVEADMNPDYDIDPGGNTYDYIFILSMSEVKKYYPSWDSRKCMTTAIAKAAVARAGYSINGMSTYVWWIRTPGDDPVKAPGLSKMSYCSCVGFDGAILSNGNFVSNEGVCIRPAMWIDTND